MNRPMPVSRRSTFEERHGLVSTTWTRAELFAARDRPPLTPADLAPRRRPGRVRRVVTHCRAGYNAGCRCEICSEARRVYDARPERRAVMREATRRRRARAADQRKRSEVHA